MRKVRAGLVMVVIGLIMTFAFGGVASAKGKKAKRLDGILDGMTWGMSHQKVADHLAAKLMEQFEAEAADMSNMSKRDRLRKKYRDRGKKVAKTYKEFKSGKRSGLEVSIVADEFVPDNGEAVIVLREKTATKYYFFVSDELYKIAIAYDPDYIGGIAFDSFVAAVTEKYGKVKKENNDEEGFFVSATWEDKDGNRLRVDEKSDVYDTFLMAFSDISIESRVAEKHASASQKRYAEPEVGSDIDALTEGDEEGSGGSAADALLGGSNKVDLRAGLPQEDIDAMNEASITDGKGTADKGGTSDKKKRKRRRRRRSRKFKNVDKKKADGIIIY